MYFRTHKVLLGRNISLRGQYDISDETPEIFNSIDDMQSSFRARGADSVSILWRDSPDADGPLSEDLDTTMQSIEAKNDCTVVRTLTVKIDRVVLQYHALEVCTDDED